jgi:excisionase family DNA binding protein
MQHLTFEEKISVIMAEIQDLKKILSSFKLVSKELEMYTIKEACEKLNLSRTTFDRYRKDGKIVVSKVMGKNYVTSAAIEMYLNGN